MSPESHLSEAALHQYIHGICFKTGPPERVGAETEWLVTDPAAPDDPVPVDRLRTLLAEAGELPRSSAVSYEPGGQLELSSLPQKGPGEAHGALGADIAHISTHLAKAGLRLHGLGLDPHRRSVPQLALPRYTAMARYFAADGPAGRTMMCSTASLQVCLDIGADPGDARRRWRRVHRLGPLLVAAFANSPLWRDRPTGWRSTRWAVWAAMDSSRTRPMPCEDPAEAWSRYALDARLLAIRQSSGPWIVDPGLTMRDWLGGAGARRPTHDDLLFHLSTLFPPVRPRGWLELRMIDALPDPWWGVALGVASALVDDPVAAAVADAAVDELLHGGDPDPAHWMRAARDGLTDPALARCATACFEAAAQALPRMGAPDLAALVREYTERYVERGRCPADDLTLTAGAT